MQCIDLEDIDSESESSSLQHEAPAIISQDDGSTVISSASLHQCPHATNFPLLPKHTSSSATDVASKLTSEKREESSISGTYFHRV